MPNLMSDTRVTAWNLSEQPQARPTAFSSHVKTSQFSVAEPTPSRSTLNSLLSQAPALVFGQITTTNAGNIGELLDEKKIRHIY